VGEIAGEEPALALVGHSDTVWPVGEPERRPAAERDGKLYGPGAYDMRSGLCLILWALRYIAEQRVPYRRRILVFLAADEETGSATARPHMYRRLPADGTALVPEPPCPDGSLKIERKGVGIFRLDVTGREAHAGAEPERGVSAISELARMILEIESWADAGRGWLVSVGAVEGGTARNVVPGSASCSIDFRYDRQEDGARLEKKLRALTAKNPDAKIEVSGSLAFPPLVPTRRSRFLSQRAIEIAGDEFGVDVSAGASGGGSDGSHLAARGMTVLDGLGIDGGGAHAKDEHIRVDRVPFRAAFFTRLVLELGEFPDG